MQEILNGQTTTFAMDYNTGLTQVLNDGTNNYIYGNDRIAQVNTGTEYFLGDALGSVRQLTNSNGAVTYASTYDPYGVTTQTYGASQTAYGYTNEYTSQGLVYLRARMYSPSIGRFLTRDTWEGNSESPMSFNRWMYVADSPITFSDPTGHNWPHPQPCWWGRDEKTGKCKDGPLPPVVGQVVGGTPTIGGYDTLVKLGIIACAYTIGVAIQHIDIDNPDRNDNKHIFYYYELGAYPQPGRPTRNIIHDLQIFEWMPGIRGMIGQLENSEDRAIYKRIRKEMPLLMGRKFEAERAIFFYSRSSLTEVNSTAEGFDLRVQNFGTIKYVQVKWADGAMSRGRIREFLKQVKNFPSRTMLLETTYILDLDKPIIRQNGGRELPFSYP